MLGDDDSKRKHQSAALGGSRDSFFLHDMKGLENSNYSVILFSYSDYDMVGIHRNGPGYVEVTTLKSQGVSIIEVYFLLI